MFAEAGKPNGKVAWVKFWAHNDEESKQLEELYKRVMGNSKEAEKGKDK